MSKTAKQILDGLGDRDPDLREMACRDLEKGLLNDLKLTQNEEQQLAARFLEMMAKDQTLKVLASHSLVNMLSKSATSQNIGSAVTTSVQHLLGKHAEDEKTIREVSTYALKGLITASDQPSFSPSLVHGPILGALHACTGKEGKDTQIVEYALDVLETLLVQWGSKLNEEAGGELVYDAVQTVALPYLQSQNYNIQTKAIGCVGNLGAFLSYNSFEKLIEQLISYLKSASATADCSGACTTLTSLSTICRLSPRRFSKFLAVLVPLVSIFVQAEEFTDEGEQVKVCEAALITFDTIVTHCSTSAVPYYGTIQEQALQFIAYDPTVIEGEDDPEEDADNAEQFEYGEDEGVVDDETDTWRVRKACIRCIGSISGKAANFGDFFDTVAEELIKRFTDSQVNVKIEIFKTFITIVARLKTEPSLTDRFIEWVPTIVTGLGKEFKSRGDKSKIEASGLVQEISGVSQGIFDEHLGRLIPGLVASLKDPSENLRAAAASTIRSLVQSSVKISSFHSHVATLVPALITAINTANFKVTAAALRAASVLSRVLPSAATVDPLYAAIHNILTQDGAAHEVKDAVMTAAGQFLAVHGDKLASKVGGCVKILGDRLAHATTCVAAAKALQAVASSPLKISFGVAQATIAHQLIDSLKLNNRHVRQASLESLITFVTATGIRLEGIDALANHLEAEDLLITGLVLKLVAAAVKANAAVVADVIKFVIPKVLQVLKNPATQGGAVVAIAVALTAVAEAKPDQFDVLLSQLHSLSGLEAGTSVNSTALVLGAIVHAHPKRDDVLKKFLGEAKAGSPLAISVLGEVGARVDICSTGAVDVVLGSLGSSLGSSAGASDKSVRFTAARAIGSIAVGNPKGIIGVLEKQITKTPYYVIGAIRQMLDRLSTEAVEANTEVLLRLLLHASEKSDEVVRDAISDCLGKLVQANPKVISTLEGAAKSDAKGTRACVIKAISLSINQSSDSVPLVANLPLFLDGIGDKEVEVRTVALGLFQTCVAKNLSIISPYIVKYEQLLAVESKRRPELISKVVVGNTTLVTDLGLPSRRTTLQILDALLSSAQDSLNIPLFILNLASGSKSDEEVEIQVLSHKISIKLAAAQPEAFLRGIVSYDLSPVFLKLLPNTAIDVDIKANDELVASARPVIHAAEDQLYTHKYLSIVDSFAALEALCKAGFGGLRSPKLYKQVIAGLGEPSTQEAAIKVLTELWKLFDTKLQNNLGHKSIADDTISGLDELLATNFFKNLPNSKDDNIIKVSLAFIRVVDVAFARLDRHKKDMKVGVHGGFNTYLASSIKKGNLANKYAEISK